MRIFLFSLLLSSCLFAQTESTPNPTSAPMTAEIANPTSDPRLKKVEDYFNSIKSLKANFLQTNNSKNLLRGSLALQKPGKMWADYGTDSPLLMVSDGTWVTNYDKELKQSSHIPLSSHPAEIMLRDSLSFNDGFDIKKIESGQGLLKVTLTKKDAIEAGTITFIFLEKPLELREWVAVDGQGNVIRVSLSNVEKNVPLSSSLFVAPKNEAFTSN